MQVAFIEDFQVQGYYTEDGTPHLEEFTFRVTLRTNPEGKVVADFFRLAFHPELKGFAYGVPMRDWERIVKDAGVQGHITVTSDLREAAKLLG